MRIMNKYLLIIISLLFVGLGACQDDDTEVVPVWEQKNLYRVKEIAGTNAKWGDFRLEFSYSNEKLDSIVCYDKQEKMLGRLSATYSNSAVYFYWYDYVVSIDADSVAKIHPDSIPYSAQLATSWNYKLDNNEIIEEIVAYYGPKELPEDADFDYTYELKGEMKYMYEHDVNGRNLFMRVLNLHETDEMPIKYEFLYEQNLKNGYVKYVYGIDSWNPSSKVMYIRGGEQVCGMEEFVFKDGWVLQSKQEFIYQGSNPIRLENGGDVIEYVYEKGCLTKLQSKDIEIEIKYEAGHGNFYWLQMPEVLLSAAPYIK